ncbi:MAG TPA: hypothetical protein VGG05_13550 [Pseudonocardiaceae bacterium]|jgi:hypothetical protein
MTAEWDQLRDEIEAAGGIKTFEMARLRDVAGWAKLGVNVVVDIANHLRDNDMDTLPQKKQLPLSQWEEVRVYSTRSRVGKVIGAVLKPSSQGDRLLAEIGNEDAGDVLEKVRRLVCLR